MNEQIHYECQRCTRCCRWPGFVKVTEHEINRLAEQLGLGSHEFIQLYTRLRPNRDGLALIDKPSGECIFLEGNACAVQRAKPEQCRTFPNRWNFPGWREACEAVPQLVNPERSSLLSDPLLLERVERLRGRLRNLCQDPLEFCSRALSRFATEKLDSSSIAASFSPTAAATSCSTDVPSAAANSRSFAVQEVGQFDRQRAHDRKPTSRRKEAGARSDPLRIKEVRSPGWVGCVACRFCHWRLPSLWRKLVLTLPMKRRDGFTMLEVCLAVAICLMLFLIAVPSVRGVLKEQRLHASYDAFDLLARKAQARSVDERRTYAITWRKEGLEMAPLDPREEEKAPEPELLPVAKNEKFTLERPAAMGKDAPPVWVFWRSGVCEPAVIHYEGPNGTWSARYNALTAHGTFLAENPR